MKQLQIMNRKIEKLLNKSNYEEILKIIESKTTKPSLAYKDLVLSSTDFTRLKRYSNENILKNLHSGNAIPNSLISLSLLLGEDHIDSLKSSVTNFIVSRKMLDISHFIQDHLNDLSNLSKIFNFIETTLENTYKEYEILPHSWNLDLKILTRSIITLKHAICEYLFSNEPKPEHISEGIKATVTFEKKLNEYFDLKKCCQATIDFNDDECIINIKSDNIKCIHKRMISSLFIPYLDVFMDFHLSKTLNEPFDQLKCEKNIMKYFIDLFKDLQNVYEFVCYFEDKSIFVDLFQISDRIILSVLQKIKLDDDSGHLMVFYSTIIYIQKVIEDFSNRLIEYHRIECSSRSLASARKLEKAVDLKIEREISFNYPDQIEKLPEVICECFSNFLVLDDDIKKNVLEICMVQILLKIRQIKLNLKKAEDLLSKIFTLEQSLSRKFKVSVNFGLLKDYLKIFTFPIDEPRLFIENFSKLSTGKFDLIQILKVLEDQCAAQEIYQAFKEN